MKTKRILSLLLVFTKIANTNNKGDKRISPQAEPMISTVRFAILFIVFVNFIK